MLEANNSALYVEGERERLSDKSLSSELQYFWGKGILQQSSTVVVDERESEKNEP